MITVREAEERINEVYLPFEVKQVPLEQAVGYVLAEDIIADRDFPPYDRVMMDGIALKYGTYQQGVRSFPVQEMLPAGSPPVSLKNEAYCIEVMTGAVLPPNCDTVVRYEDIEFGNDLTGERTATITESIESGSHVHKRGTDRTASETIVEKGILLGPAEIGVLATVGFSSVQVLAWPEIAVVSSGDELVNVDETPDPHQIRQSNSHSIVAALGDSGLKGKRFHLRDDKDEIIKGLQAILDKHRVVILSGGVSKGKKDYIPEALKIAGIEEVFHRVTQRPGKPFWFGRSEQGHFVFALPGNPVSTFMNFYRFIKPWLFRSAGIEPVKITAILSEGFEFQHDLTYFLQVKTRYEAGRLLADPRTGHGSGDLANLVEADGFIEFPAEKSYFHAGESFNYYPFRQ